MPLLAPACQHAHFHRHILHALDKAGGQALCDGVKGAVQAIESRPELCLCGHRHRSLCQYRCTALPVAHQGILAGLLGGLLKALQTWAAWTALLLRLWHS